MKITYDSETKRYSATISIGEKEPLSPKRMMSGLKRAIPSVISIWCRERDRELTDMLFWFEEGIR